MVRHREEYLYHMLHRLDRRAQRRREKSFRVRVESQRFCNRVLGVIKLRDMCQYNINFDIEVEDVRPFSPGDNVSKKYEVHCCGIYGCDEANLINF